MSTFDALCLSLGLDPDGIVRAFIVCWTDAAGSMRRRAFAVSADAEEFAREFARGLGMRDVFVLSGSARRGDVQPPKEFAR